MTRTSRTLGGGENGGGEPRGPGADDKNVPDLRVVDGFVESQAIGDLAHCLDCAAPARRGRSSTGMSSMLTLELVQQVLYVGILLEVEIRVRMGVAWTGIPGLRKRPGAELRTDQDDVAESFLHRAPRGAG